MDRIPSKVTRETAELRGAPRIPLIVRVHCRKQNTNAVGQCENVSESGMLVRTDTIFPEGSDVFLRFALPPQPKAPVIQTEGIVMRASNREFMAIQFSRLQPNQRSAISQYIGRFLANANLSR